MIADKVDYRSKWSEDDEEKLIGALENIKGRCKEEAKKGVRKVSFPLVGPIIGFKLAERPTSSLQTDRVKHTIGCYFYNLGLDVRWELLSPQDLWIAEFPKRGNHVHLGKACPVWEATLFW